MAKRFVGMAVVGALTALLPSAANAGLGCEGSVVCFDQAIFENAEGIPGAAESDDMWGEVVAVGELGDEEAIVFGSPSEDVGSVTDAGVITIAVGGTFQVISQGSPGVPGTVEAGDRFGASLAFDGAGNLWVGVPGEDVGTAQVVDAGMVMRLSGDGVWTTFHQGSPGVPGAVEAGDQFGEVLDAHGGIVGIGAPHEDIGSKVDAGQTWRTNGVEWLTYYEDAPGVPGVSESGDRFGAALAFGGDVVGVPGEDLGSIVDAGVVVLLVEGTAVFSENSPGIPGVAETGDQFGEVLEVVADLSGSGGSNVIVGSPHEDIGSRVDAGSFVVWDIGEDTWEAFSQSTPGVPGVAESGDLFGSSFAMLDSDVAGTFDLVIGVPGEASGSKTASGGITIWNTDLDEFYWVDENTPGVAGTVEAGDEFGASLASFNNGGGGVLVTVPREDYSGKSNAGLVHVLTFSPFSL